MDLAARAGLYVHVPFCQQKCPYCSFYSFAPQAQELGRYVEAVRLHMRQLAAMPEIQALSFATVFFGGGTPTILPVEALAALLADCHELFSFSGEHPEITIEVNPGTVDGRGVQQLRLAGFNRLSVGVQSLDDRELQQLGRIHTSAEALATIRTARQAGFDNLSFDLMYGLPGQKVKSWQQTLDQALAVDPKHLSMYELTVEEETPFFHHAKLGQWSLPQEDEVLAMMAAIETAIDSSSLVRYEISNYAVPGWESRHNLNYWHNGVYLGVGPGAVSSFGGLRRAAVSDLAAYCRLVAEGQPVWPEVEQLDVESAFRETVVMGLRMLVGVSLAALQHRFGIDPMRYYGDILHQLFDQGLVALAAGHLVLTRKGLPLANQVMAQLV